MSLLGWVVGAAGLDEWGRREEQERELEERDRQIREQEGAHQPFGIGEAETVGAEGAMVNG